MIDRETVNRWSKDAHKMFIAEGRAYDFTDVLQAVAQKAAEAEREACAQTVEMTPSQFGEHERFSASIRNRGIGGGE